MDFGAFEKDLREEAKKVPKDLLLVLRDLAEKFGPILDDVIPSLFANLQNHVMAIAMEGMAGALDKEKLNAVISRVLKELA